MYNVAAFTLYLPFLKFTPIHSPPPLQQNPEVNPGKHCMLISYKAQVPSLLISAPTDPFFISSTFKYSGNSEQRTFWDQWFLSLIILSTKV